jgi:GNAT superfamily N-acetyltransferase
MDMQPLCEKTLAGATILRDSVFGYLSESDAKTLEASIFLDKFADWYKKAGIEQMSYWVSINTNDKSVSGLVGLYTETNSPIDEVWLGWYCVDSEHRGQGVGGKLLSFAIEQAKIMGKTKLRLYTTDSIEYEDAIKLYKKLGFKLYRKYKSRRDGITKLWYSLSIK